MSEDLQIQPTPAQMAAVKREIRDQIAVDLGLYDSRGKPDLSQFKHWWVDKQRTEERWGRVGVTIFTSLTIMGLGSFAAWAISHISWGAK